MIYLINGIVWILLSVCSILLIREVKKHQVFHILQTNLQEKPMRRKEEEEQKVFEDGNGQKYGFFYKMDLALLQSGIQKRVPILTSEVFLLLLFVLLTGGFLVALLLFRSALWALVTLLGLVFFIYLLFEILLDRNTEKIEADILKFANLLDNYGESKDDLVAIMDATWIYLKEPLRSAVHDCCMECRTSGDNQTAFKRLELSVRHKQFGELIRNLELCSRYNANYAAVIRKNRDVLEHYLSEKEIRKHLANQSRINILVLYAGAALVIKLMESIGEDSILQLLSSTLEGNVILAGCFLVILYSIHQMILMGKGR